MDCNSTRESGRYLGILGKDDIDVSQVPGIMLLEEEDCKLLAKVQEVLNSAEIKMNYELAGMGAVAQMNAAQRLPGDNCGYGSKILRLTAYMLDKAAVWPGEYSFPSFPSLFNLVNQK
jgi:hypothetical protein